MNILIINGPNLNMLGKREPEIYGAKTLDDINQELLLYLQHNSQVNVNLAFLQSNAEHVIVDKIQQALNVVDFIIINPGAFTHTSVAIRDALLSVKIPFLEVHLSNIHSREEFRRKSYLSDIATGVICGLGDSGYKFALMFAINKLTQINK